MTRVLGFVWRSALTFDCEVITEITQDQRDYYGLDEADSVEPADAGRVLVLLTTPTVDRRRSRR